MARTENIQPRRQLLEIWQSVAAYTMAGRDWRWGGAHGRDCISDAEQLLCLLLPATSVGELRLERPNETALDVQRALQPFGDRVRIPRMIVRALEEYLDAYTDPEGRALFGAGNYFIATDPAEHLSEEQIKLDTIVAYAVSVKLCLAAIGFLEVYAGEAGREWLPRVVQARARTSDRLTAALVGLLRGFTINAIDPLSADGANLMSFINRDQLSEEQLIEAFNERMQTVRSRLSEARMGITRAADLDNENFFFEVGWTWGVADDATEIELDNATPAVGIQKPGVAQSAPYLYYTLVALDAIDELVSERTRVLGLLDPQQERLATNLATRRELTQLYWSRLARFGSGAPGTWPLEDLPWRSPDGEESDYFSLLVCAVLILDLQRRSAGEDSLRRLEPLLTELASRSRITRRPIADDPMVSMHYPGLLNTLEGSEQIGPMMGLRINDFAPLLLKRVAQVAGLTNNPQVRDRLLALAVAVWDHLSTRRMADGDAEGLWDDPSRVFRTLGSAASGKPRWNVTYQIIDALVTAADAITRREARSPILTDIAAEMVSEAEYQLNQRLMRTPALNAAPHNSLQQIRRTLQRARELMAQQPSVAIALCVGAVGQLDRENQAIDSANEG